MDTPVQRLRNGTLSRFRRGRQPLTIQVSALTSINPPTCEQQVGGIFSFFFMIAHQAADETVSI